ncbi:MAG: molybdopterin-guanine dinucleotide biosynthesis protein MobB [Gammaproteobacteria bacterium]|jgi:molybdopterin-guanine dinucleotide biosynthesis protein MobB
MKTYLYRGVPVLGFAAYSGTGKTTLLKRLLPRLIELGRRPAIVKHAHHDFDIDYPGKDSYELRKAGANQVLVGSNQRWAMVVETPALGEAQLVNFLARLELNQTDVILVEGFRDEHYPKIEIQRTSLERPLFYPHDNSVIAIATDATANHNSSVPVIELADIERLAEFVLQYCNDALVPTRALQRSTD